jgi:hypothetical protein
MALHLVPRFAEGTLDTSRFHRWHATEPHTCRWSDAEPHCDPMRLLHWVHDRIGVPIPNDRNGAKEYVTDLEWGEGYLEVSTADTARITFKGDDCVRHTYTITEEMPPVWPWGIE